MHVFMISKEISEFYKDFWIDLKRCFSRATGSRTGGGDSNHM
jgi:hypothetical protein